jgi:FAD:protein FMN transferase
MTLRKPTRREVLALGTGAFLVAAIPFARGRGARLVRRRIPIMGTLAEVVVVHSDPQVAHEAIDAAFAELRHVDRAMSRFRPDSDVGRINRRNGDEPVRIGPDTALVLTTALRFAEATDGAFDPCLGRAVELWNVEERNTPPDARNLRPLAARAFYRTLDIDGTRARLTDPEAAVDLGGIAKGHAVDRAVRALREHGIRDGLVNAGGDLHALGRSPGGDPWRVGIRSASDPTRLSGRLTVEDEAVATSGDYRQFFDHDGRRYHHLLDPRTAEPLVTGVHSLTIVAPTCMTADAAATAAFGRDPAILRAVAPDARIGRTNT